MPQAGDSRPDGLAWRQTTGAISVARYVAAVSRIRRRIETGTTLTH
jgi:hypothetical protein